jgi:hypothetical protein
VKLGLCSLIPAVSVSVVFNFARAIIIAGLKISNTAVAMPLRPVAHDTSAAC